MRGPGSCPAVPAAFDSDHRLLPAAPAAPAHPIRLGLFVLVLGAPEQHLLSAASSRCSLDPPTCLLPAGPPPSATTTTTGRLHLGRAWVLGAAPARLAVGGVLASRMGRAVLTELVAKAAVSDVLGFVLSQWRRGEGGGGARPGSRGLLPGRRGSGTPAPGTGRPGSLALSLPWTCWLLTCHAASLTHVSLSFLSVCNCV